MDYSKYYTPPEIAKLLIHQLRVTPPKNVVDICCGSCNLLHAAKEKWKTAIYTGVDVNPTTCSDIIFAEQDGRYFSMNHPNEYSMVLANPPFDHINEINRYPKLYSKLGFPFSTSRLEIEMLLANLNILCENGTLLIIMPSTFINGQNYKKLKCYIANKFYLQKIVHLPDDAFGNAHISTCALIIKKSNVKAKVTKRYYVESNNNMFVIQNSPTIITKSQIESGIWNDISSSGNEHIRDIEIKRGNISSQFFNDQGKIPVLHTAKPNHPWKPSVRYALSSTDNPIFVESGDIIISRIGKSAGQWCKYIGERIRISDCLYVIRDSDNSLYNLLKDKEYSFAPKGVATKYITISDFQNWIQFVKDKS